MEKLISCLETYNETKSEEALKALAIEIFRKRKYCKSYWLYELETLTQQRLLDLFMENEKKQNELGGPEGCNNGFK